MANQLKKITTRAKQIRKKHPSMQWKTAIKKAGADYRSGKIGSTKKKKKRVGATLLVERGETRRTKPKRVVQIRRTKKGLYHGAKAITGVSTGTLAAEMKRRKKAELANALLRKETATTQKAFNAACDAVIQKRRELKQYE